MELTVRVHHEDQSYWAEVVEMPGCFASADTLDELMVAVSEAVSLYAAEETAVSHATGRVKRSPLPLEVEEIKMLVPSA